MREGFRGFGASIAHPIIPSHTSFYRAHFTCVLLLSMHPNTCRPGPSGERKDARGGGGGGGGLHLSIPHARVDIHAERVGFPLELDIAALLALLRRVLLEHAWPKLPRDHLILAVALPLALGGLDHVLIPLHLHRDIDTIVHMTWSASSAHALPLDPADQWRRNSFQ